MEEWAKQETSENVICLINLLFSPQGAKKTLLRNVGELPPDNMALH
jgi:hypothetical protein